MPGTVSELPSGVVFEDTGDVSEEDSVSDVIERVPIDDGDDISEDNED